MVDDSTDYYSFAVRYTYICNHRNPDQSIYLRIVLTIPCSIYNVYAVCQSQLDAYGMHTVLNQKNEITKSPSVC